MRVLELILKGLFFISYLYTFVIISLTVANYFSLSLTECIISAFLIGSCGGFSLFACWEDWWGE